MHREAWQVDQKPTTTNYLGYDTVNSLSANSTASFTDSISTANLSVGAHTLWVAADNWDDVGESNDTNNWLSVGFIVTAPPRPDLIVSSITPAVASVSQGTNFGFSYSIKEQGGASAGMHWTAWQVDQKPTTMGMGYLGYDAVNSLAANSTASSARATRPTTGGPSASRSQRARCRVSQPLPSLAA
jgi:hypothetical protein